MAKQALHRDLGKLPAGTQLRFETESGTTYELELTRPLFGEGILQGGHITPVRTECIVWGTILDEDLMSFVRRRYITQGYRLAFSTAAGTYQTNRVRHLWVDDEQVF